MTNQRFIGRDGQIVGMIFEDAIATPVYRPSPCCDHRFIETKAEEVLCRQCGVVLASLRPSWEGIDIYFPHQPSNPMHEKNSLAEVLRSKSRVLRDRAHTLEKLADTVSNMAPDIANRIMDAAAHGDLGPILVEFGGGSY